MTRSLRARGADAILEAAENAFDKCGYDGASVRAIASAAGVAVSVLYHHYGTKQDLLYQIIEKATSDLSDRLEQALIAAGDDPLDQFAAAVTALVLFYADRPTVHRLADTESRSLTPANRRRHLAKRRSLQTRIEGIVEANAAAGTFNVSEFRLTARAIVVLCRDVGSWFSASGRLSASEVANLYVATSLRLCGADEAVVRRARVGEPAGARVAD
jgi:AcrR family transcriptional regulator